MAAFQQIVFKLNDAEATNVIAVNQFVTASGPDTLLCGHKQ